MPAVGVSSGKEEVHAAISGIDKGLFPKAFCKVVADALTGSEDHCLVMHADGAGTKSALAWIYWKETGDLSVWKGIAQDALVMNLDDLLCVGATGPILVSSTIGRNKRLVPGEVISALIQGTEELMADWRKWGLDVKGTGGGDRRPRRCRPDGGGRFHCRVPDAPGRGHRQCADSSRRCHRRLGQRWSGPLRRQQWNGGTGSNGLTSARHDMFGPGWHEKYPECFDPGLEDLVYTGPFHVTDDVDGCSGGCRQAWCCPRPAPMRR